MRIRTLAFAVSAAAVASLACSSRAPDRPSVSTSESLVSCGDGYKLKLTPKVQNCDWSITSATIAKGGDSDSFAYAGMDVSFIGTDAQGNFKFSCQVKAACTELGNPQDICPTPLQMPTGGRGNPPPGCDGKPHDMTGKMSLVDSYLLIFKSKYDTQDAARRQAIKSCGVWYSKALDSFGGSGFNADKLAQSVCENDSYYLYQGAHSYETAQCCAPIASCTKTGAAPSSNDLCISPISECASDEDCGSGQSCQAGACVASSPGPTGQPLGRPCTQAAECNSGLCDPSSAECASPCTSDTDCPGQACYDGVCGEPQGGAVGTACGEDADCASGLCDGPSATCVSCNGDADCAAGEGCSGGVCVPLTAPGSAGMGDACAQDADCASGACDATQQSCVAAPVSGSGSGSSGSGTGTQPGSGTGSAYPMMGSGS